MPRFYILILITLILLTSCGPQATAIPTQQPTATALSTVSPAPTNTPTPTLEPWMVSLPEGVVSVAIENETIYGVDAQGKQIMKFDLNDSIWVEVVPQTIILAKNAEMEKVLRNIEAPANIVPILDANGVPFRHGYLGRIILGDPAYYSADVIGFYESSSGPFDSLLMQMNLEDGRTIRFYLDMRDGRGSSNPILFVQDKFDLSNISASLKHSTNNVPSAQLAFMKEYGIGHQIIFAINPSPQSDSTVKDFIGLLEGSNTEASFKEDVVLRLLVIMIQEAGKRP